MKVIADKWVEHDSQKTRIMIYGGMTKNEDN